MSQPWGDALVPWFIFGIPAALFALMWYLFRRDAQKGGALPDESKPAANAEAPATEAETPATESKAPTADTEEPQQEGG